MNQKGVINVTREEAIERIKIHKRVHEMNEPGAIRISEALDKAIEALEQESCEDCISRQAMLDMATTIQTDDFSGNEIIEVVTVEEIKELPSVTPQPKVGRWINHSDDLFPEESTRKCSECGHEQFTVWLIDDKYCPNCGAKMEVEE